MKKSQKEFIRKVYNNELNFFVCEGVKRQIREVFPKLFKGEFGKGDWITPLNEYEGIAILCFQGDLNSRNSGFGLNYRGVWKDKYNTYGDVHIKYRKLTTEEVEEALVKEAKRRGFKKGILVTNENLESVTWSLDNIKINENHFSYQKERDILKLGQKRIYEKGKWAEIVSPQYPKHLQKAIDKYGIEKIKEYICTAQN